MKAQVICCNNTVEFVVLAETQEEARPKLEELAQAYFDNDRAHWQEKYRRFSVHGNAGDAYGHYRTVCFWQIHTVDAQQSSTRAKK